MRLAGVKPDEVTDIVVSHAHWDHLGGVDLFPTAIVWIRRNVYPYRNLTERKPSATFSEADYAANVQSQQRMIEFAGSPQRVIPGHDALQFKLYSTEGRIATLR